MIDKDIVERVAVLSRLHLDAKELAAMSEQLSKIVSYIDKLNQLDTGDVAPTSHVSSSLENVDRPDTPAPSLPVEDALAAAQERKEEFFKIPKVIEGK